MSANANAPSQAHNPLAPLRAWAENAVARGDVAGVCVGGSMAAGEALHLSDSDRSDLDIFVIGPRARRKSAMRSLAAAPGLGEVHAAWMDVDGTRRMEPNFGAALVRRCGVVFPNTRVDLLDRFPKSEAIPPFEFLRLLWNRWCEYLHVVAEGLDTRRARIKIGADIGTIALHLKGLHVARSDEKLRALGDSSPWPAAQAALRVRARLVSPDETPVAEPLLEESRLLLAESGVTLTYAALYNASGSGQWPRAWVRTMVLATRSHAVLRALPLLRVCEDPRLRSMTEILSRVAAGDARLLREATNDEVVAAALTYWRIENGL